MQTNPKSGQGVQALTHDDYCRIIGQAVVDAHLTYAALQKQFEGLAGGLREENDRLRKQARVLQDEARRTSPAPEGGA